MRTFRSLDLSVKVAINFMSQPSVLQAKDISIYRNMLIKMVEYGVFNKRKQTKQQGADDEKTELPNLLGEKNVQSEDIMETTGPSSEAMKAFFEASLTTVGASDAPSAHHAESDNDSSKVRRADIVQGLAMQSLSPKESPI